MAVTNAIPELWSARLLDGFQRRNVWGNLVTDVSSEFASGGDTLHLNEVTSNVTVKDYTRNQDIADPELITTSDLTLTINQEKYFNIAIDDVDATQAKPALMDKFSEKSAREVAKVYDTFMSTTFGGGSWVAAQSSGIPDAPSDLTTVTTADMQKAVTAINVMLKTLQDGNWPIDQAFMVMNTTTAFVIREYLIRNGIGSGQLADQTFLNGTMSSLFGIRTVVDANMANAQTNGAVQAYVGTTDAVFWAQQIRRVVAYRPEKRFSDAVKGLFVWGGTLVYPMHRHRLIAQTG